MVRTLDVEASVREWGQELTVSTLQEICHHVLQGGLREKTPHLRPQPAGDGVALSPQPRGAKGEGNCEGGGAEETPPELRSLIKQHLISLHALNKTPSFLIFPHACQVTPEQSVNILSIM